MSRDAIKLPQGRETFWNRFFIAPLRDSEGAVTYYVGVQVDVSEAIAASASGTGAFVGSFGDYRARWRCGDRGAAGRHPRAKTPSARLRRLRTAGESIFTRGYWLTPGRYVIRHAIQKRAMPAQFKRPSSDGLGDGALDGGRRTRAAMCR